MKIEEYSLIKKLLYSYYYELKDFMRYSYVTRSPILSDYDIQKLIAQHSYKLSESEKRKF